MLPNDVKREVLSVLPGSAFLRKYPLASGIEAGIF